MFQSFNAPTFKCTPFPFVQLFEIRGLIESKGFKKQVSLLYFIMSRKTVEDYSVVFVHILNLMGKPEVIEFVELFRRVWLSLDSITVSFHPAKWPATSVQNQPTTEN